MRLRDLKVVAVVDAFGLLAVEERDERVDFTWSVGDAEREDLDEAVEASESRGFEAAALRGGMVMIRGVVET